MPHAALAARNRVKERERDEISFRSPVAVFFCTLIVSVRIFLTFLYAGEVLPLCNFGERCVCVYKAIITNDDCTSLTLTLSRLVASYEFIVLGNIYNVFRHISHGIELGGKKSHARRGNVHYKSP